MTAINDATAILNKWIRDLEIISSLIWELDRRKADSFNRLSESEQDTPAGRAVAGSIAHLEDAHRSISAAIEQLKKVAAMIRRNA